MNCEETLTKTIRFAPIATLPKRSYGVPVQQVQSHFAMLVESGLRKRGHDNHHRLLRPHPQPSDREKKTFRRDPRLALRR
ncbi:hypothetical protein Tco_1518982 [Tanacetum coccineum]